MTLIGGLVGWRRLDLSGSRSSYQTRNIGGVGILSILAFYIKKVGFTSHQLANQHLHAQMLHTISHISLGLCNIPLFDGRLVLISAIQIFDSLGPGLDALVWQLKHAK